MSQIHQRQVEDARPKGQNYSGVQCLH